MTGQRIRGFGQSKSKNGDCVSSRQLTLFFFLFNMELFLFTLITFAGLDRDEIIIFQRVLKFERTAGTIIYNNLRDIKINLH